MTGLRAAVLLLVVRWRRRKARDFRVLTIYCCLVSGSQSAPAGGSGSAGGSATSPTVGGSAPSGSGTAVFLSNLPFTTRWQDLKDIFRPHNLVPTHADVMVDSAGRSKGMGTVRFGSREDAEQAVQIANGLSIGGRQIGARLDRFL